MIVTESKNRKIKICDQILEEIYSQIQKNDYDPEKGGIIVGRENLNNENIILEYISKPLKNDICTRTRYTRKDEGHLKYFEKLYNERQYEYIMTRSTPPESIVIGREIKKRHPEIKWIASLADPVANNPYELKAYITDNPNLTEEKKANFFNVLQGNDEE